MNLHAIRGALKELDLRPGKSLGQNFLHDQNVARWIVEQLEMKPGEHLVEIGPGLGALTNFAIGQCDSATLIEKDRRLTARLRESCADAKNVSIVEGDALEFDVRTLFPRAPVKVLGNLPYYITTPLLFAFTDEPTPAARLVFTMQRELAERLCAKPRTKDYGALTLIVQRRWRVNILRTLPGSVFFPEPKVESAVVLLTPRAPDELPECDGVFFRKLVKQGFSQRRKQLRKLIAGYGVEWAGPLGISPTARAEELSLEQWIQLANWIRPADPKRAQDVHGERFDVVDESNRVIGTATRHEVHTRKLRHRAVHVFVFNGRGDLFLQKRSRWKDAHPSKWDSSASGHLNAGDDYDETAAREIEEELGVKARAELVTSIAACENTGWEFVQLYRAAHDGPFRLAPSEIECGEFFPMPLIREWIAARPQDFATGFIECFNAFANAAR